MGRRKKEPEAVHRAKMAAAAQKLFSEKGIKAATMDDIAREAGYSKATLYVYFKNKEEIIGYLVLRSMKLLHGYLDGALLEHTGTRERYQSICWALVRYEKEYPDYFAIVLGEINVRLEGPDSLPVERETFEEGERIREKIAGFLSEGQKRGEFRHDIPVQQAVFMFWSMLSGMIRMASKKQLYFETVLGVTKKEFLDNGFSLLYRSIINEKALE